MDLIEKIDQLRIEKDWTLAQLAKQIGVSETTVYAWFDSRHYKPSRKTIEEICRVFGLSLAEFYSDIDTKQLAAQEIVLLELFRKVPPEEREKVLDMIKVFTK